MTTAAEIIAAQTDEAAFDRLYAQYRPYLRYMARQHRNKFYNVDPAEIESRVNVGFWMAVRDYRPERVKIMRWTGWLWFLVERSVLTGVKTALRRNPPGQLSLSLPVGDRGRELGDIIPAPEFDITSDLTDEDILRHGAVIGLTTMEMQVYELYILGNTTSNIEIGWRLGYSPKQVDNARQRIAQKARQYYESGPRRIGLDRVNARGVSLREALEAHYEIHGELCNEDCRRIAEEYDYSSGYVQQMYYRTIVRKAA